MAEATTGRDWRIRGAFAAAGLIASLTPALLWLVPLETGYELSVAGFLASGFVLALGFTAAWVVLRPATARLSRPVYRQSTAFAWMTVAPAGALGVALMVMVAGGTALHLLSPPTAFLEVAGIPLGQVLVQLAVTTGVLFAAAVLVMSAHFVSGRFERAPAIFIVAWSATWSFAWLVPALPSLRYLPGVGPHPWLLTLPPLLSLWLTPLGCAAGEWIAAAERAAEAPEPLLRTPATTCRAEQARACAIVSTICARA